MSIIKTDGGWWTESGGATVAVTGKTGAVLITNLAPSEALVPAFNYYETVAYVARGTIRFLVLDLADELHGQELPEGSFFRVPPTLIHWMRNVGSGPATVVAGLVDSENAHWGPSLDSTPLFAEWEAPDDFMRVHVSWPADPSQYRVTEADEEAALSNPPGSLAKSVKEVEEFGISHHLKVPLRTKIVCGRGASIMVAKRSGAYHSTPHCHPAEQINAVIQGSNWGFCIGPDGQKTAVETGNGSVFRFPSLAAHWAWGKDGSGSHVVEFHFPGLHGDPDMAIGTVTLISEEARFEPALDRARNMFIDPAVVPVEEAEALSEVR